jgi:transposase
MSYDPKFRERALKFFEAHSTKETCEAFGISPNALYTWKRRLAETGSLENKPLNRPWRKIDPEKLRKDVEDYPDAFNRERAQRFGCTEETVRLALKKLKKKKKKKTLVYREKSDGKRLLFLAVIAAIAITKRVYSNST